MLRFHFNCYALCQVEPEEDPAEKPFVTLIGGLFASIEDANKAADANEARLLREHEAWCKQFPFLARTTRHGNPPAREHYEIVPLAHVTFKSLDALEDAILQAARLQFAGVGVEVSQ